MGIPLSKLKSGHAARVLAITDACDGLGRRRLLDLGVTPGVSVFVERANTGASAVAYRVRHTVIVLRREQAEAILVQRISA